MTVGWMEGLSCISQSIFSFREGLLYMYDVSSLKITEQFKYSIRLLLDGIIEYINNTLDFF